MILALIGLCGCTQNNGYIGPIFGSWSLVEISENGDSLVFKDETTFSFQNEVVQVIRYADNYMSTSTRYGNFVKDDETLTLKFQTRPTESGSQMYMTPDWIYLPIDLSAIYFDIKKLNGKEMILVLESGPTSLQYKFVRTW